MALEYVPYCTGPPLPCRRRRRRHRHRVGKGRVLSVVTHGPSIALSEKAWERQISNQVQRGRLQPLDELKREKKRMRIDCQLRRWEVE
jgi:hypothetical protein